MAANVAEITMRWREALQFEAAAPGRPPVAVDGDSTVATSPVELLLVAAATCTASDVVLILQKQRVALRGLEVQARGTRRAEQPRRYTALHFVFIVAVDVSIKHGHIVIRRKYSHYIVAIAGKPLPVGTQVK